MVSKREVSKEVSAERMETERSVVEANAQVIADIRMAHRNPALLAMARDKPCLLRVA